MASHTREVSGDVNRQCEQLLNVVQRLHRLSTLTGENAQLVARSVLTADAMNGSAQELRRLLTRVTDGTVDLQLDRPADVADGPGKDAAPAGLEFF